MKRRRILVDLRTLADRPSGIGYYAFHAVRFLREEGFRVEGVSNSDHGPLIQEVRETLPLHLVPGLQDRWHASVHFAYFRAMARMLGEGRFDVFWEPNFFLLQDFRKTCPGLTVVASIHDAAPIHQPEDYSALYRWYFSRQLSLSSSRCDWALYLTHAARREVLAAEPRWGRVPGRILPPLIGVGPPGKRIAGLAGFDYYLYYGNLEQRKGADFVLQAFDAYRRAGGDKHLVLFGKIRSERVRLELDRMRKKHPDAVHYLGYVDDVVKWSVVHRAYAGLFPARLEGYGMPAKEMNLAGKPVIASDIPVFREVLTDRVSFVPVGGEARDVARHLMQSMFDLERRLPDTPDGSSGFPPDRREQMRIKERYLRFFAEAGRGKGPS